MAFEFGVYFPVGFRLAGPHCLQCSLRMVSPRPGRFHHPDGAVYLGQWFANRCHGFAPRARVPTIMDGSPWREQAHRLRLLLLLYCICTYHSRASIVPTAKVAQVLVPSTLLTASLIAVSEPLGLTHCSAACASRCGADLRWVLT